MNQGRVRRDRPKPRTAPSLYHDEEAERNKLVITRPRRGTSAGRKRPANALKGLNNGSLSPGVAASVLGMAWPCGHADGHLDGLPSGRAASFEGVHSGQTSDISETCTRLTLANIAAEKTTDAAARARRRVTEG